MLFSAIHMLSIVADSRRFVPFSARVFLSSANRWFACINLRCYSMWNWLWLLLLTILSYASVFFGISFALDPVVHLRHSLWKNKCRIIALNDLAFVVSIYWRARCQRLNNNITTITVTYDWAFIVIHREACVDEWTADREIGPSDLSRYNERTNHQIVAAWRCWTNKPS